MNSNKLYLSIKIFLVGCILGLFLWIPIPEISHFIGVSSITYVFLLAVGSIKPILLVLALSWIGLYAVNLVIWFIFAIKCRKPLPLLVTIGADMLISLLVIFYKIHSGNNTDLGLSISGFIIRFAYYCWMIICARQTPR